MFSLKTNDTIVLARMDYWSRVQVKTPDTSWHLANTLEIIAYEKGLNDLIERTKSPDFVFSQKLNNL